MEREKIKKKREKKKGTDVALQTEAMLRRTGAVLGELMGAVSEASAELFGIQEEKRKKSIGVLLSLGLFFAATAVCAVVSLARFPLSVYPAGFALLSALGGMGKFRGGEMGEKNASLLETALLLSAFAGVLISCLLIEKWGFFYFLAYLLLFFVRAYRTGGQFRDGLLFRVTLAAAFGVGLSLLLAFFEDFTVNRVFGAVSTGVLTPILTYLICGFYIDTAEVEGGADFAGRRRVYLEAGLFTLFYLFLFALKDVTVLGSSLSFVLAVLATLGVASKKGALFGAAAGMIGGMACGPSFLAPSLAVGGFFSGLFFSYSGPVAVMIAFASSCGYSLFTEGFSDFAFYTADYLVGAFLFVPFMRFLPKEREKVVRSAPRDPFRRETVRRTGERLKTMSDAFRSLSEVFYTVSDTMKKPTVTETSRLVSDCFSGLCSGCALSGICWGAGEEAYAKESLLLATRLLTEGRVTSADLSPEFARSCKEKERLVEKINRRYQMNFSADIEGRKTGLLAGEYSSVSRLLQSTAATLDRELAFNPSMEEKAKRALSDLKLKYRRVAVFGEREMKVDVYGVSPERVTLAAERIREAFGREFGFPFDAPDFLMYEESCLMRLRRKRRILLECAKSGCVKKGETVSGDSCLFFETKRDYFYTLICDGMGSGREAAFTSRLAALFIEKLMQCATPKNVTLEMLNSFLMAKNDETFTTVDLLEVDLLEGRADFIKAGAAPSFVLRGDTLHRIESRTPPAGILSGMCAEKTSFELKGEDLIILMSDGAESVGEGSGWLVRLLSESKGENASELCGRIFQRAKEKGEFRDDLSICVLKIMNAK